MERQGRDGREVVEIRIPWPGPRPYDEHEWRDFYGRGKEILDLVKRVRVEKVTLLLGASGSGKTSLVRAGVVALLRNQRYLRGDRSAWPVLLLRRWGARGDASVESNLLHQLEEAIETIGKWSSNRGKDDARRDADFLRSIVKPSSPGTVARKSLVDLVEALAREQAQREGKDASDQESPGSGVILVFDQFEELLRSSGRARAQVLRIIGDLVESKAPIRILLSMRQEYRYALRDLEILIGGLGNRSIYLDQLDEPSVVQVIDKVSGSAELGVDGNVAGAIVRWLTSGQGKTVRDKEVSEQDGDLDEAAMEEVVTRPDLLRLQAVLVDLCRFAVGEGAKRVTEEVLRKFVSVRSKDSRSSIGGGVDDQMRENRGGADGTREDIRVQEVFESALERWIEAAIASEEPAVSPYATFSKLKPEDLGLQVRRIAVRLAPFLSSADYKVSQEENVLLRQALGEDIGKLLLKNPKRVSEVTIIEDETLQKPRLDWQGIGGVEELPKDKRQFVLSGRARIDGWTLEETGDRILCCFKETLERLVKANILQRTTLGDQEEKVYWELVHDQFGPHFTRWAVEQKNTWDDCRSSLVVSRGVQPIGIQDDVIGTNHGQEKYELEGISWQGCGVAHVSGGRVAFHNVRFKDCFLLGTIFERVDFVACDFVGCELKGALFRHCNFRRDAFERVTTFKECDSNVAIVGGSIQGLEFRNCQLNQPAIKDVFLEGNIVYSEGSKVIQGLFESIRVGGGREASIVVESDSEAAYCFAGSECFELLKVARENPDLPNRELPEEFRTGR
jgi:conflict system STAND superfamily ATPase/pentapeptide repeat protein